MLPCPLKTTSDEKLHTVAVSLNMPRVVTSPPVGMVRSKVMKNTVSVTLSSVGPNSTEENRATMPLSPPGIARCAGPASDTSSTVQSASVVGTMPSTHAAASDHESNGK